MVNGTAPKGAVLFFCSNETVKIDPFLNETSLGFQKTLQNTSMILTFI
jgi:hypothetical protein